MTFDEYQVKAGRTINPANSKTDMTRHALFGLCSEVGELHSIYQKTYQGHTIDRAHIIRECGDILWMLAEFCSANDILLSDVARENIEKLWARYPDGFDADKSQHRTPGDI